MSMSRWHSLNTDQAFNLLKEAGITDKPETFRRWLREGKIKATGFTIDDDSLAHFLKEHSYPDKDLLIRQLRVKIKAQEEYIEGIEKLHETSTRTFSQQRDQLNNEILYLKKVESKLRKEMMDLLKENIELRNRLIDQKIGPSYGEKTRRSSIANHVHEYRQKLGLSKIAGTKEMLARYKELLKNAHPDHGGNPRLFQYIKTEYDQFKRDIEG
jgi:hypothetical protein